MRRVLLFAGIGFVVIALIIVAVTLIARQRPRQTKPAPAKGPVTLTIWRYSDDESVFKPLIEEFTAANPNVKIEYVKKELKDYEAESTNALASGKGPDIWSIPNDWLPRHNDKLVQAPSNLLQKDRNDRRGVNKIVEESYVLVVAQEVILGDKVYGLPLTVDTLALYLASEEIRKLVNEKVNQGVKVDDALFLDGPQTWNDMVNFVKTLTVRTKDQVQRSVVALGAGSNVEVAPDLLAAIMLQNRTQMASPDNLTATFNLPAKKSTGETFNPGLQALDFYTSFANPAKETFTWTPKFDNGQQAFLDGKTLMAFGYSDFAKRIEQIKPDFRFKVVPLPQIAGSRQAIDFASYPVETVTNNAENSELAWAFVKFVASTGLRDYLAITEKPSPLKVQDPPQTIQDRLALGFPFRFQQQTAQSWNRGKDPDKVEAVFRTMIDDIVARGVSSQQAIDNAAQQVTEVLRQAGGFEPKPIQ